MNEIQHVAMEFIPVYLNLHNLHIIELWRWCAVAMETPAVEYLILRLEQNDQIGGNSSNQLIELIELNELTMKS